MQLNLPFDGSLYLNSSNFLTKINPKIKALTTLSTEESVILTTKLRVSVSSVIRKTILSTIIGKLSRTSFRRLDVRLTGTFQVSINKKLI